MLNLHIFPKEDMSPTMLLVHLPFYLKEVVPVEQAQAINHMEMVQSPPIVRMKSLMTQGQIAPLDAHHHHHHHQGITLEPFLITLAYLLTIRVLATLGRYPNLMEPAIPSGRTRWRSI
jgi:hypothetical protein